MNWLECYVLILTGWRALGGYAPIETYQRDRDVPDGEPKNIHTTIPAMTEEEAIEYLIMKDIPPNVWRDYEGNRCIMRIVPVELIPSDRSFRNAWKINQETEMAA